MMIKSIILVLIGLLLIFFALVKSENVHWPLLAVMLTTIGVGFLNPTKGWIIVIVLTLILIIFGFFLKVFLSKPQTKKLFIFFVILLSYQLYLVVLWESISVKYLKINLK